VSPFSGLIYALMKEESGSSEMLISTQETPQLHNLEDHN
jgi:hypothetical protein